MKKDRPNSDLFQKCGGTKYAILRLAKFQLTNPRFKANGSLFSRYFAVFNHFSHQIHVEKVFYVTCLCTCRLCKCVLCMSVSVQIDSAAAFFILFKAAAVLLVALSAPLELSHIIFDSSSSCKCKIIRKIIKRRRKNRDRK